MSTFILMLIAGVLVAVFSTHNTMGVSVNFLVGNFLDVPLYLVVIGALLLGAVFSWILSLGDFISSSLALSKKDRVINNADKIIRDLKQRVRELELENAKLQGQEKVIIRHDYPEKHSTFSTFVHNLRHRLS
jgi:uncharacterized integral membrane protein